MAKNLSVGRILTALLTLALVAGACSATTTTVVAGDRDSRAIDFEASPAFLAQTADRVEAFETFRFEMFMEMTVSDPSFGSLDAGSRSVPVGSGEVSGDTVRVFMDFEPMMRPIFEMAESMGEALPALGSMEMTSISNPSDMYLNAPFFDTMLSLDGGSATEQDPMFAWMRAVATGWGRIDLSRLTDESAVFSQLNNLGGMQAGASGEQVLDMLRQVTDVTDGGASTVRGVSTRIARADTSLIDMFAALGMDMESAGVAEAELRAFADLDVTIDAYVDAEGLVRRIEFFMDFAAIAPEFSTGGEFTVWQQVDYLDYGAPLSIELPADAVDITDDFLALMELAGPVAPTDVGSVAAPVPVTTEPVQTAQQVLVATDTIPVGTTVLDLLEAPTLYLSARALPVDVIDEFAIYTIADLTSLSCAAIVTEVLAGEQLSTDQFDAVEC